ncbi:unnamed protein product, partial [Gongylonema pulchrum]|uniref:F-box domain-containing protein n=1 Tax=Gongylonema pulchrum TaxID=637853 RepID=A0A183CW98_9BILA
MEISSDSLEQPTTSACKSGKPKRENYQRRSVWVLAKRIFRKRLLFARRSRQQAGENQDFAEATGNFQERAKDSRKRSEETVLRLLVPVMQQVFPYLDIYDRIRLREVCRLTEEIFQKSLISLPPIKLRGVSLDEVEIWTDHSDLIIQLLVPEFDFTAATSPDATRVDRIEHLWLETAINGELCNSLLTGMASSNSERQCRWRPLKMTKLTIVGGDDHDCEMIAKVVGKFSSSLDELRFRHLCVDFGLFCEEFWQAVEQCNQLKQLQYETCRLDSFSHMHLQQALDRKHL